MGKPGCNLKPVGFFLGPHAVLNNHIFVKILINLKEKLTFCGLEEYELYRNFHFFNYGKFQTSKKVDGLMNSNAYLTCL